MGVEVAIDSAAAIFKVAHPVANVLLNENKRENNVTVSPHLVTGPL